MINARARLLASTLMVGAAVYGAPAYAQITTQEQATQEPSSVQTPQTQADQDGELNGQEIVVTGTLIQNPNLVASNPVTVVSEQEIELRQNNTAEALLRELPGVVPNIGSAVNNGNGGSSFVDLRGLGANRNLVLIDGVRLVPSGLAGQFDLNNIPLALVQRVDLLTGGASTTYGADAVSGVVNFITRSDFSGVDLSVSNQITEEGDGNIFRVDATIGANLEDGRGNAVFSIGYQEADPVFQGARDISVFQVDSFTGGVGGSGTTTPSRFGGINTTGADSITVACNATGGEQIAGRPNCNSVQGNRQVTAAGGAFRGTGAFDAFNFNPFNVFQTPFERFNIYGAANYEISDGIEVYTRGLFSKNTVSTVIAPSGAFNLPVNVSLNQPFLSAAQRNAFCAFDVNPGPGYIPRFSAAECAAAATAPVGSAAYREVGTGGFVQFDVDGNGILDGDGDGVADANEGYNPNPQPGVFRRSVELGPRISDYTTTIFDYRLGLRGNIVGNIGYDVFGSYGESENDQLIQGYTLNSRVRQSLLTTFDSAGNAVCQNGANDCVPVNFFGPTGSITPEQNTFLNANSRIVTTVSLAQARGTVSGDFGVTSPFATEAVSFAVGGEFRRYRATIQPDVLSQGDDLGGSGGAQPVTAGGFEVYEAVGELILPLVADRPFFKSLQVQGGVRYSEYKVLAAQERKFDTTTYNLGGTWEPTDGVKLRGTYARAVRAPNIQELFEPANTTLTNLANDPCANLTDTGAPIAGRPAPSGVLRDVCIAQGAPASTIGSIPQPVSGQAQSTGGGNLDLQPEKSTSYTFGAVFTPRLIPGFSASIDYYNIKVTDAITFPTPDDVINACFGAGNLSASNPACTSIRRNPLDGGLAGLAETTPGLPISRSNLGRLRTDGIDLVLNYSRDIGPARLALSFQGNWTNKNEFQATPTSINRDCVGLYSANCGSIQPEYSFNQRTTVSFGDVDVSLLWRYLDRVDYEFAPGRPDEDPAFSGTLGAGLGPLTGQDFDFNSIEAYHYFDLSTRIGVTENFTLIALVQNLLNKEPPLVGNTIGSTTFNSGNTFPSTYDSVGRRFTVTGRLRF